MKDEQFAWDSESECFYYINNVKKMYTRVTKKDNRDVYDFLYYVYCVNWNVIEEHIANYTFVATIKEISDF